MSYNFKEGVINDRSIFGRLVAGAFALIVAVAFSLSATASAQATGDHSLFGGATSETDGIHLPSNSTDPFSGVSFELEPGTTVADLDLLEATMEVLEGNCGVGSPRFQVGTSAGNIFVYVGDAPNFTSCADGSTGNLIDDADLRVDTSQVGGTFYDTWANAETLAGTDEVTGLSLVADGGWSADQEFLLTSATVNETSYDFVLNDKDECKNGGWENFGFKNQGQCVASVVSNGNKFQ